MKDPPPDESDHEPPDDGERAKEVGDARISKHFSRIIAASAVIFTTASSLAFSRGASSGGVDSNDGYDVQLRSRFLQDVDATQPECTVECCKAFESDICTAKSSWVDALPVAVSMILIVVLLSLSALFSGLTLGLMSLDKTGLEIVMGGDDARSAKFAAIIYPLREDGNLLLCTLLLGNVAVNSLLSIILAEYAGGITGFLVSTFAIVIFGEIVPQALCSRYALRIGSATVPLVRIIRAIFFVIAKPLAWCLDKALGRELASTYSTTEMLKLVQIHMQENILDKQTANTMTGALLYKDMSVKEAMTPLEKTFMLNVDERLSFDVIATIFRTGYSRIPVYEISPNNVIGLLFVKDLIFIDPEDATPIRSFVQIFGRGVHVVWPDDKLGEVLNELKRGKSHLALVRDVNNEDDSKDPFYELKGIITLEDIVEKILGDTIVDETDAFVDSTQSVRVDRAENFEWARLRMLDSKIVDEFLSHHEVKAVTAHMRMNYSKAVELLTDAQLLRLVTETPVSNLPTAPHQLGDKLPSDLLYEKGKASDTCTLVLGGKVTVLVGSEDFRSDISSWSLLGIAALSNPSYVPDFTAFVSDGPCRCLKITNAQFNLAVDASAVERNAAQLGSTTGVSSVMASQSSLDAASVTSVTGKELKPSRQATRRQKLLKAFALNRNDEYSDDESGAAETAASPKHEVGFQEGGLFNFKDDKPPMKTKKGKREVPAKAAKGSNKSTAVRFDDAVADETDAGANNNANTNGDDVTAMPSTSANQQQHPDVPSNDDDQNETQHA